MVRHLGVCPRIACLVNFGVARRKIRGHVTAYGPKLAESTLVVHVPRFYSLFSDSLLAPFSKEELSQNALAKCVWEAIRFSLQSIDLSPLFDKPSGWEVGKVRYKPVVGVVFAIAAEIEDDPHYSEDYEVGG